MSEGILSDPTLFYPCKHRAKILLGLNNHRESQNLSQHRLNPGDNLYRPEVDLINQIPTNSKMNMLYSFIK